MNRIGLDLRKIKAVIPSGWLWRACESKWIALDERDSLVSEGNFWVRSPKRWGSLPPSTMSRSYEVTADPVEVNLVNNPRTQEHKSTRAQEPKPSEPKYPLRAQAPTWRTHERWWTPTNRTREPKKPRNRAKKPRLYDTIIPRYQDTKIPRYQEPTENPRTQEPKNPLSENPRAGQEPTNQRIQLRSWQEPNIGTPALLPWPPVPTRFYFR